MNKPHVLVTRQIFQAALERIGRETEMEVWPDDFPPPPEVLRKKAADVEGILCMLSDRIDSALMDAAPHLKVISSMAVGYDNIDIAGATRRSIRVGYTPGVLTETTADLAFALLTAAARRVVEADRYIREGQWLAWSPMTLLGRDLHNATLGIVGLGRIGQAMARRARGFDMRVLYYSRHRLNSTDEKNPGLEYAVSLTELLKQSDFISLHVPLTPETRRLIGPAEFALMKPTAILINTTRGPVVDQQALFQALKNGRIAAAGIDVTEVEPIPPDDPLLSLNNLVITPHIGSASVQTRTLMALMAADNLLAGLRGEPLPNCVNP